jgi:hypothetical protein
VVVRIIVSKFSGKKAQEDRVDILSICLQYVKTPKAVYSATLSYTLPINMWRI